MDARERRDRFIAAADLLHEAIPDVDRAAEALAPILNWSGMHERLERIVGELATAREAIETHLRLTATSDVDAIIRNGGNGPDVSVGAHPSGSCE